MKKKIGYTTGVFDLFHIGHLNLLKNAKSCCDYLIVGVSTDEVVRTVKGQNPAIPFEERLAIIQELQMVDSAVAQEKIDEIEDCFTYSFDIIFKGSDWKNSEKWVDLEQKFRKMGVDVMFFPYTKSTSSTKLRNFLDKNCS